MTCREKLHDMRGELRALYKAVPEAAKDTGVLGHKEKDLVAIGMAVVLRCEPCITTHVDALRGAGRPARS